MLQHKLIKIGKICCSTLIIIMALSGLAQAASTIDGYAYLEGQTDHSGIEVLFERTVPGALSATAVTDSSGYYQIPLEGGIYNASYSKDQFISQSFTGEPLYADTTLAEVTLDAVGLSGDLIGTLTAGTYRIGGNVTVPAGETLTIEPGTTLLFKQNVAFTVNGTLTAEGTESKWILFTRFEEGVTWRGIDMGAGSDDSVLSYCKIEYSNNSGLSVSSTSPTLSHLEISNNSITPTWWDHGGGGIYLSNSNVVLTDVVVTQNSSAGFNGQGGGIFVRTGSPKILNSKIVGNSSSSSGGGIFFANWGGWDPFSGRNDEPALKNVIISQNSAGHHRGGGVFCNDYAKPQLTNVTITENVAMEGAGVYCHLDSKPLLENCIVSGNITNEEYGWGGYGIECLSATPIISYSNFWGNESGNFNGCGSWLGVNVTENDHGEPCDAYQNIQADPLFVDPKNNDYHLQETSPCVDAGNPDEQYNDGNLPPGLGTARNDMGAYGGPENALEPPAPTRNVLTLTPSAETVSPGETVTVDVHLTAQSEIAGLEWSVLLPDIIEYIDGAYMEMIFDPVNRLEILRWEELIRELIGAISQRNPAGPVNGEGVVLTLTFNIPENVYGDVELAPTANLADQDGNLISVVVEGTTIIVADGIHGGTGSISGSILNTDGSPAAGVEVKISISGNEYTVTTDENGAFQFDDLRALEEGESFTITANTGIWCIEPITVDDVSEPVVIDPVTLLAGDLNGDGYINISDFTLMSASFGKSAGDEGFNERADINGDATVNIQDLVTLASHWMP